MTQKDYEEGYIALDMDGLAKIVSTECPYMLLDHLNNDPSEAKWNNLWYLINECFEATAIEVKAGKNYESPDTECQELAIRTLLSDGIKDGLIENGISKWAIEYLLTRPEAKVIKSLLMEETRQHKEHKEQSGVPNLMKQLAQTTRSLRSAGVCFS